MANCATFYVPDLTAHARRIGENKVPSMRVTYINPLDGKPLYSLLIAMPNTGP